MISKSLISQVYLRKLEDTLEEWKSFGAVSTPKEIVDLMINLINLDKKMQLDILEPACGFCNFIFGIYTKYPKNNFFGVEINHEIYGKSACLFKDLPFNLIEADFLLWHTEKKFDLIIGNPPYGIIGHESHYPIHTDPKKKNLYKTIFNTWFGKYNIYGAFIEKSISLLKSEGKLAFIIPATWMILDEFKKLRIYLSRLGKVKVYYLGKKVFDKVSVSVCILLFEKNKKGAELYIRNDNGYNFNLVTSIANWNGDLLRFENENTKKLELEGVPLAKLFEIKISARSPEIRNLSEIKKKKNKVLLPFLNGRNIKKGFIDRNNYTKLWIKKNSINKIKPFYTFIPRIVVGHTKGGKIIAALEEEIYPYVGDVYHLIPKIPISKCDLIGVVNWLNSETIDNLMRTLYKDITPHTTATQLKIIPLPKYLNKYSGELFY